MFSRCDTVGEELEVVLGYMPDVANRGKSIA